MESLIVKITYPGGTLDPTCATSQVYYLTRYSGPVVTCEQLGTSQASEHPAVYRSEMERNALCSAQFVIYMLS